MIEKRISKVQSLMFNVFFISLPTTPRPCRGGAGVGSVSLHPRNLHHILLYHSSISLTPPLSPPLQGRGNIYGRNVQSSFSRLTPFVKAAKPSAMFKVQCSKFFQSLRFMKAPLRVERNVQSSKFFSTGEPSSRQRERRSRCADDTDQATQARSRAPLPAAPHR